MNLERRGVASHRITNHVGSLAGSGAGPRPVSLRNPRRARILALGKRRRRHDPVWLQELRAK